MFNKCICPLAVSLALVACLSAPSFAENCKNDAIGTSRTLSVKPVDYPLVGKVQYAETLRLSDREVVLTFDDGPVPVHSEAILDVLARECAKATFFMLGKNAAEYPHLVRRVFKEGHTIGFHTFGHADLTKVSLEQAQREVRLGIAAVGDALGGLHAAPFFRAPYLALSRELERHLLSQGLMIWSIDVDSEDWLLTSEEKLILKIIERLEKAGRGILLMHDVQPITARVLSQLLGELKRRNFRIVNVVPASEHTAAASK